MQNVEWRRKRAFDPIRYSEFDIRHSDPARSLTVASRSQECGIARGRLVPDFQNVVERDKDKRAEDQEHADHLSGYLHA